MKNSDYQERRMKDVESTHQFSKSAAQALILINGGAATAILASKSAIIELLAKHHSDYIASSLALFAGGVLLGTIMNWCERQALYYRSQRWQLMADNGRSKECVNCDEKIYLNRKLGERWHRLSKVSFFFSGLCFSCGCIYIACGVANICLPVVFNKIFI